MERFRGMLTSLTRPSDARRSAGCGGAAGSLGGGGSGGGSLPSPGGRRGGVGGVGGGGGRGGGGRGRAFLSWLGTLHAARGTSMPTDEATNDMREWLRLSEGDAKVSP